MFRQTYVVYTLLNGDIDNKKGSLDSAAKTVKKTVERRGRYDRSRMLSISRQRSSCGFGKCLAWWMWVVPWLVVLGGVEGVPGVPIPDCTYSGWSDRTCGIRQAVDAYINSGDTGSYGPIEDWDTSLVTDMSRVFRDKSSFNANISAWQVGKVTTMAGSTFTLSPPSPRSGLF